MKFPDTKEEKALAKEGFKFIAGIDEAGRGPLAGPVVAACVIMPLNENQLAARDSKTMTEKQRDKLFDQILENCIDYGIGIVENKEIDEINIYQAAKLAMKKAVLNLKKVRPDFLLVDAMKVDIDIKQKSLIKGDAICYSISAASILAKVTRDRIMKEYHLKYPDYGFEKHKGYGTAIHIKAITDLGPCKIHRFSFNPIKSMLKEYDFS